MSDFTNEDRARNLNAAAGDPLPRTIGFSAEGPETPGRQCMACNLDGDPCDVKAEPGSWWCSRCNSLNAKVWTDLPTEPTDWLLLMSGLAAQLHEKVGNAPVDWCNMSIGPMVNDETGDVVLCAWVTGRRRET